MALPSFGRADDAGHRVEAFPLGSVDWSSGRVQAIGQSMASKKDFGKTADPQLVLAAARAVADRNLLETLKAVRVNTDLSVGQAAERQPAIMENLQTMIVALETTKKAYLSDGTVQITLQMPLYGGFSQLILPPEIQQIEPIRPVAAHAGRPDVGDGATTGKPNSHEVFTGLVVDARGMPFRPAMVVQIEDENGKPVYGPAFVSREHAVQSGICGFYETLDGARQDRRVQGRPLTVKGLRLNEGAPAVVISNADAAKLRSSGEHLAFLRQCRVVMVLE
ncbi:MAG: hypothetical protein JEZ11_01350 [Desulfobacterales bacterium]|nr:hypothetical protein [Desulfobacterales bacterium]